MEPIYWDPQLQGINAKTHEALNGAVQEAGGFATDVAQSALESRAARKVGVVVKKMGRGATKGVRVLGKETWGKLSARAKPLFERFSRKADSVLEAGTRRLNPERVALSAHEPASKAKALSRAKSAVSDAAKELAQVSAKAGRIQGAAQEVKAVGRVAGLTEEASALVKGAGSVAEIAQGASKLGKVVKVGGKVAGIVGVALSVGEGVYEQQKLGQSSGQSEISRKQESGLQEFGHRMAAGFSAGWDGNLTSIRQKLAKDREAFESRVKTNGKAVATLRLIGDSVMTTVDIFASPFNVAGRGATDTYLGYQGRNRWLKPGELEGVNLTRPSATKEVPSRQREVVQERGGH